LRRLWSRARSRIGSGWQRRGGGGGERGDHLHTHRLGEPSRLAERHAQHRRAVAKLVVSRLRASAEDGSASGDGASENVRSRPQLVVGDEAGQDGERERTVRVAATDRVGRWRALHEPRQKRERRVADTPQASRRSDNLGREEEADEALLVRLAALEEAAAVVELGGRRRGALRHGRGRNAWLGGRDKEF